LLKFLSNKNIIKLYDVLYPSKSDFNKISFVLEFVQADLKKLLKSNLFLTI